MHAAALPDRRFRNAGGTGRGHSVQSARHARPAVGEDLGREFRKGHGPAQGRTGPRFQMSARGAPCRRGLMMRIAATLVALVSVALLAPRTEAHHSYAMYDGSVYRVFTGVIVRIVPNAAHFEMHFVPLNEQRDALVRDENGEQLVWVVQMESAAEAFQHGITRESFPQGTVMSMGVHPRRDGKP